MSDRPADRVQELFDQAVALPPERRAEFLAAACACDPALRADVEGLLAYDSELTHGGSDEGRLRSPLVRAPRPTSLSDDGLAPPAGRPDFPVRIGRYRVLRRIAEGGMGAVYEAEQESPRRLVALKVVRPGVASPALVKRFTHEAQILARLHHPGIAQVYEAGLADDGQPFFAMEFIRGLRLDEYANLRGLDLAARVGLVARVCDAVQHAHDQGVIHRDLKPSNILVEESGQPKVLDFGVARATITDLLTAAGLTRTGQLLGTPDYMSPEQVTAQPAAIDQRADVYALGVILFELAAGRLPYRLEDRPLAEAARLIVEHDAPPLGTIDSKLRGDVETIVAKALEKDPARRYSSAADLAADLRRWLAHEPILARPPSALYHLRKFARRHTGLVGGVVATAVALVLGLLGTILFAVGEARQRGLAEKNARTALSQAYRARLAAAAASLSAHDVTDAAHQLDEAPDDLRGWEWRHLHSRLDDSTSKITLPPRAGARLLPARDRLRIAIVTGDGVSLTDLDGGEPVAVPLRAQGLVVGGITQTPVGLRIAAWVDSRTFRLLDENGRELCRVDLPRGGGPRGTIVSADGSRLASDYTFVNGWWGVRVFDATSGRQIASCKGHPGDLWSYAFSPDSKLVATGGEDATAKIWDATTGGLLFTCQGHSSKVMDVSFSPDGKRLLSSSSDGTVRQWAVATGREVEPSYDRHSGDVTAAVYSPDGQWVASAGTDRTVRVWQAKNRQDVAVLHGHTGAVTGVAFDLGGHLLASVSRPTRLVASGDGTVRGWEVDPRATLPVLRGHTSYVYPVCYSPDGRWIASGGWDNTVRLWDARTGEACGPPWENGDVAKTLAFSPDSSRLVSARQNRLQVWEVATGRRLKEIQAPASDILALEFHPDGATLAALDGSGNATVFGSASGAVVTRLRLGATHDTRALAYSPDGRWLAGSGADLTTVCLFDAHKYEPAARFTGHEAVIRAMAFSPDSRRLASCGSDQTIRVWRIDSGDCRVLSGHTDEVFAVAFHPDGNRLASAGRDRAIWLWDLERGEEVARLQGHTTYVWSLAFSPDGTTLASASGDFTVRLWDTAPLRERYDARREAEAMRPEAERLVESLWKQKNDPAEIAAALRADQALSEPLRHAALRAVLRRAAPQKAAADTE
jgi:WD40 repeat protein/predicted Ser/Thr protein kinase